MLTPLGYEEMRRLNRRRLDRSLRQYEIEKALATSYTQDAEPIPCPVIELPAPAPVADRIGA